jgi:branched-chain amino acid transport system ATP-binding protein
MGTTAEQWTDLLAPPAPASEVNAVELDNLVVAFGGVTAIDGLSYHVANREFVAIVGQNGAGKTTLLNSLSGLVRPTDGTVRINGEVTNSLAPAKIAARRVGRSFQDPKLLDAATVVENLQLGAQLGQPYGLLAQLFRPRSVKKSEELTRDRAIRMLDAVGLRALAEERVAELPFGLRKVVDLLRALSGEPTLLLLDEPSSGLDSEEQDLIRSLLSALRETRRVTAIIVEHHWDVVRLTTDRVLVLENGKQLMTGASADVLGSSEFRGALLGTRETPRSEVV